MAKDCPKPHILAREAARKQKFLQQMKTPNSVHVMLAHFFHELESNVVTSSETSNVSSYEGLIRKLYSNESNYNVEILAVKKSTKARGLQISKVASVDSGAHQFVIGEEQAELYCKSYGGECNSRISKFTCWFGKSLFQNLWVLHVTIRIAEAYFIDM